MKDIKTEETTKISLVEAIPKNINSVKDFFDILNDVQKEIEIEIENDVQKEIEIEIENEKGDTYFYKYIKGKDKNTIPIENAFWYRGEEENFENKNTMLVPSLFRESRTSAAESAILGNLHANFDIIRNANDTVEKLSLMQHYGIPTRILDWSRNPLVALYFAVEQGDKEGCFFILNPQALNSITSMRLDGNNLHYNESAGTQFRTAMIGCGSLYLWMHKLLGHTNFNWSLLLKNLGKTKTVENLHKEIYDTFDLFKETTGVKRNPLEVDNAELESFNKLANRYCSPVAVLPSLIDKRMTSQYSALTLHGGSMDSQSYELDPKTNDIIPPPQPFDSIDVDSLFHDIEINGKYIQDKTIPCIRRYSIPKNAKDKIKKELEAVGINEMTIFPGEINRFKNTLHY